MPLILRLGDPGSHGGEVCTAAVRTFAENKRIARIGDTYCCPEHGDNPIVTGCTRTYVEKIDNVPALCAFDGSKSECGATLHATALRTYVEGG